MNSIYVIIILSIIVILLTFLLIMIIKNIKEYGFLCGNVFISIHILFYIIVPVTYLVFPDKRDNTTIFNKMLGMKDNHEILMSMLVCSFLILLLYIIYSLSIKKGKIKIILQKIKSKNITFNIDWNNVNIMSERRVRLIADISMLLGSISILICIFSVGGIKEYIAIGSFGRGVGKDITNYISSSLLPLITLSSVILVSPYLYRYLMGFNAGIKIRLKFFISFFLSLIYLFYNQGRLPLILFFIPFLLDMKIARKAKISTLVILIILSFPFLNILSSFFSYLSFGHWSLSGNENDFINTLLLEFTYPFSNFLNKTELISVFGSRFGVDYFQWILLLIPSFILSIFGVSKSSLITIGLSNTNAYSMISGLEAQGGIPTDFIFFSYAQFGWFSLLLSIFFIMRMFNFIDERIKLMRNNNSTRIITLRICFLVASIVNNFDFSVIFRMRFDLIMLIYIVFYITKNSKKIELK